VRFLAKTCCVLAAGRVEEGDSNPEKRMNQIPGIFQYAGSETSF
jgi:hypothetical protein